MNDDFLLSIGIEIQIYASLLLKFFNDSVEKRAQSQEVKLSSLQFGVLRIFQFERLTISEISQRMGVEASTLVRSIDSMERKGLVKRESDPNDRRRNPVCITQKGLDLITKVPTITEEDPVFKALASMDEKNVLQLNSLIKEIIRYSPDGKFVTDAMDAQKKAYMHEEK